MIRKVYVPVIKSEMALKINVYNSVGLSLRLHLKRVFVFPFQSVCAAVAFFYSNYLFLQWQLLIMAVVGFFGTITFFTVEWEAAARSTGYRNI